ncbi:hypothetical protein GSI_07772 [Ganoderma sinense ZZ0214-1]|uniref:F-box domain-containing protein n=1 Tax=Ganoderma sinense ZZ0214-1 TaxID=1077348 RepID=A0A2G8S8X5_9APHY|nr:hypothetical protein GSI_07663 [Ganoderma sinense ZZ0214-1]PIL30194.1 hypothetical protein GSI_07772 [Ganoderma sinense ZZ0214-1]
MSSTTLNVDVLAIVCEFLTDVPDILAFSLTCSALRLVANRWLLSMKPIYLADGVSVRRFHSFLFADVPARAPHIRELDIINPPPRPPLRPTLPGDSSLLREILISCPRLERVAVFLQDGSHRCTDDPRVTDAIAGIQSLRSLSILGTSVYALDLLRQVRAPLRKLNIDFLNDQLDFWSPAALEMFLPRHLPPILEKLELYNFITDLDDPQLQNHPRIVSSSQPYRSMTTYPLVRSLYAVCLFQRPLLDHLQHFFPALDGTLSLGILGASPQPQLRRSSHSRPVWKKLDRVICDPPMFYVLGLRCPIRLVMLDFCSPLAMVRRCVEPALREHPVPRLKITFAMTEGRDVLDGLFSPEVARALTHLTLVLEFANDGPGSEPEADVETVEHLRWADLLDTLIPRLRPLHKLTHLRLVVHTNIHHDPSCPIAYSDAFVRETRPSAFDFAGAAARLAGTLPALRCVFVATSAYLAVPDPDVEARSYYSYWKMVERWYEPRGWRVDRLDSGHAREGEGDREGEGGPVLIELRKDVAEAIMEDEELVLSEVDNGTLHFDEED